MFKKSLTILGLSPSYGDMTHKHSHRFEIRYKTFLFFPLISIIFYRLHLVNVNYPCYSKSLFTNNSNNSQLKNTHYV
jgi:hypothetical protein